MPPSSRSTISITGLLAAEPSTMRPWISMCLARSKFCRLPPLMRSTTGRSNTSDTRSGAAGVPRTLDCASFQLTTIFGAWPGSAMVSGPWNSLISKVG